MGNLQGSVIGAGIGGGLKGVGSIRGDALPDYPAVKDISDFVEPDASKSPKDGKGLDPGNPSDESGAGKPAPSVEPTPATTEDAAASISESVREMQADEPVTPPTTEPKSEAVPAPVPEEAVTPVAPEPSAASGELPTPVNPVSPTPVDKPSEVSPIRNKTQAGVVDGDGNLYGRDARGEEIPINSDEVFFLRAQWEDDAPGHHP